MEFLDDYVQEQINEGARTLDEEKRKKAITITGAHEAHVEKELNFTPYDRPTRSAIKTKSQPIVERAAPITAEPKILLKNNNKKGRWTAKGYIGPEDEKKVEENSQPITSDKSKEAPITEIKKTLSKKHEEK